jgi:hypothetical protein
VTANPDSAWHLSQGEPASISEPRPDPGPPGIPQVFSPAEAAAALREAGLREMTECALRTRAYRKQVPFHRNGRRIVFTLSDLRDIAAGEPQLPVPHRETAATAIAPPRAHQHRSSSRIARPPADPWRARRHRHLHADTKDSDLHGSRTPAALSAINNQSERTRHSARRTGATRGLGNRRTHGECS